MRRDLNYFSKYHVAPAKTSPLKLAAISAFAGIAAIMIVLIGFSFVVGVVIVTSFKFE